ncbi:hypothetical protein I6G56_08770 [Burkholderia humptydooensis]|uniref:Uncharacterized protein n=2 Tax=Burkholderia humptydooensis TaxID=430531 RepID=A0A7U4SSM5_9BURK|nr:MULTISPECIES: hypothetical protein [Burkholderia]AJY42245.1 hypothetical protein BW21_2440 [Burkholderia sp. 2002721687]ALX42983.1 hypothetical protein AQ610_11545 [Burkholderia humptydooensis]QPS45128.1 hypothetical protein I6G56_08770 [Burkholderia humptydooensis]
MAKVIGIMGLAGAGKDTVAQMIQRGMVSVGLQHVAIGGFADYLRDIADHIGLNPFRRETKETPHVIGRDDFENRLFDAIEHKFCRLLPMNTRAELFAYTYDDCEKFLADKSSTFPYYSISPRQFMQTIGNAGRKVNEDFWIKLARAKWDALPGIVLVTDCRFENEAAVADKIILVRRPDVSPVAEHVSEQLAAALTEGAVTIPGMEIIDNDGSLDDLGAEVSIMAASYADFFATAY